MPDEAPRELNARAVSDALHARYNKPSQGRRGERYICIEEARAGAGFEGNAGQCDFLAINTWRSRGMELIGHEIKVSASDWKTELAQPEKAERFARYCRRWYIAAPSPLAATIKHEIPPAWGLLSVSAAGRVTETVAPATREPDAVPDWWWIGWLAQIDRQHKRNLPRWIHEGRSADRKKLREQIEQDVKRGYAYQVERIEQTNKAVDEIREVTGIDLRRFSSWDLKRLRAAWDLAREAPDLNVLVETLRQAADAIEAAQTSEPVTSDA